MERDIKDYLGNYAKVDFNSHAHVECDKQTMLLWIKIFYFNSHAHVERDPFPQLSQCFSFHFNSHAHVERDLKQKNTAHTRKISTHTLTWSVTS